MNGKKFGLTSEKMREILETEFLVQIDAWGKQEAECAEFSLEIYETVGDFLEKTGWEKDNPEYSSEIYLTENRICRWLDGKFLYFSRLAWEMNGNCELEVECK